MAAGESSGESDGEQLSIIARRRHWAPHRSDDILNSASGCSETSAIPETGDSAGAEKRSVGSTDPRHCPPGGSLRSTSSASFSPQKRALAIVRSPYSFSYAEDTRRVAAARIFSMRRSLAQLRPTHGTDVAQLAEALNGAHDKSQTMAELLATPYADVSTRSADISQRPSPAATVGPGGVDFTRPAIYRRQSSILSLPLVAAEVQRRSSGNGSLSSFPSSASLAPDATPLRHVPSKLTIGGGSAVVTTSLEAPFGILTLNVAARILLASPLQLHQRPVLDFFAPEDRGALVSKLTKKGKGYDRLAGELAVLKRGALVSLWVEATPHFLIWRIDHVADPEEIPSCSAEDGQSHVIKRSSVSGVVAGSATIGPSLDRDQRVITDSKRLWRPKVIAGAVVIDARSLHVVAANDAIMRNLIGCAASNLVERPVTDILPQFGDLWHAALLTTGLRLQPGLVLPEHLFRKLAGVTEGQFWADSPGPAITLLSAEGAKLPVDFQVRVVSEELLCVWISYSSDLTQDDDADVPMSVPVSECEGPPPKPAPVIGANRRTAKISDYTEISLLGRGTYGEVHLVRRKSDGAVIALKAITKSRILVDSWSRDRRLGTVPNEIKILNELTANPHPAIVELLDFFEDLQHFYVEMPAIGLGKGLDMFDYIEQTAPGESPEHACVRVKPIFAQLASAVHHLHVNMGVVHRDLKDENVILQGESLNPILVDFGSAAYIRQGPFDVFVGTVDYAAPEVLAGTPYDGPPQDCWSLGILLYTLVYRENPFESVEEIMGTPPSSPLANSSSSSSLTSWSAALRSPKKDNSIPQSPKQRNEAAASLLHTPPKSSELDPTAASSTPPPSNESPYNGVHPSRPRGSALHAPPSLPETDPAHRCFVACMKLIDSLLIRDVKSRATISSVLVSEYLTNSFID